MPIRNSIRNSAFAAHRDTEPEFGASSHSVSILTTAQVPNRPCECSDKNCWAANLLVDVMLEHFLSVHIVKGSYPNPSSIYSPADETVGGIQAERNSSSNDMLSHMFCLT